MSKELEDLEIEIKRTQLRREQLALQDELTKRERRDGAREAVQGAAQSVSEAATGALAVAAGPARWMFGAVYRVIAVVLGYLALVALKAYNYPEPGQGFEFSYGYVVGRTWVFAIVVVVFSAFCWRAPREGQSGGFSVLSLTCLVIVMAVLAGALL